MSFLFIGLGVLAYCGIGALLRIVVVREFRNDMPNKKLSFLGKLRRGILFPMSRALSGFGDYDWENRMKCLGCFSGCNNCNCDSNPDFYDDRFALLLKRVGEPSSERDGMGQYMVIGPIIRLGFALMFLVFLLGGGIVLLANGFAKLVLGMVGGSHTATGEKPGFLAGKEKLLALAATFSERVELSQKLISEGEHLAVELGGSGAAERCLSLVASIKEALSRAEAASEKTNGALGQLETEEKNLQKLSRFLEFCKKVAQADAGASVDVAGVEAAMAEALATCEKILVDISREEVALMGEDMPMEVLEAQVKDFTKERSRLRAAQGGMLAIR